MTTNNEFDALLHEALSEYRDADPLAGLESRILARVQDPDSRRRLFGWRWQIAGACAAAVALAIWFGAMRRSSQVSAPPVVAVAPAYPGPDLPPAAEARAHPPFATQKARKPSTAVATAFMQTPAVPQIRPEVFPLPTTLRPEERAFMAALQKAPDPVSVAGGQENAITIAEIEIKPLVIGGVSSSENSGEKQ
jgi:hypothetical protein